MTANEEMACQPAPSLFLAHEPPGEASGRNEALMSDQLGIL